MTKTYNDIEAVTKLLEEKERDLELAARIGQSLLEQNKVLTHRNEELENELTNANESAERLKSEVISCSERVTQLKHELTMKNGLLQIYDEAEESEIESPNQYLLEDKTSILSNWEELHKRIGSLEEENLRLRIESTARANDIELEERKELQLIHDCAKQLTEANLQVISYQEEIGRKGEDNIRQQEEITNLVSQIVDLQRKVRELTVESESLQNALQISHDCQNELTLELIEIKEKYGILLAAFHELQIEFKKRSRMSSNNYAFMPFSESLASEIESTLGSEEYDSEMSGSFLQNTGKRRTGREEMRCYSPDSVLSGQSFHYRLNNSHLMVGSAQKSYYFPDKLQIVKPMEGSATLRQWQKLATPHLGVILEKLPGVPNKAIKDLNSELLEFALNSSFECINDNISKCNINFVTTNSIFTYTTTSLSKTKDSTCVTPSFSNVQLSTGLHSPISTVSSTTNHFSLTKANSEDITASLLSSSENSIKNVINPLLYAVNGLDSNILAKSLPSEPNLFSFNTKSSDDIKASEINTTFKNESHLTHEPNIIYSSHPSFVHNNNHLKDNKPIEDHSKAMNPISNTSSSEGLGGMSFLLNSKGSDGILTKCCPAIRLKSNNTGQQKPNSLCLQNSKNLIHETVLNRADIGVTKTLRKGGYV